MIMNRKTWEILIKINPRVIVNYPKNDYYSTELIMLALERGYKVTESDLIKSKLLSSSNLIRESVIKENILYEKYFAFDYSSGLIDKNLDNKINEYIGVGKNWIDWTKIIIENPILLNVYKYSIDDSLVEKCISNGYIPNINYVKNNSALNDKTLIFKELLKQDANNIIYYTGTDEEIFKLALERGYKPNKKDIVKNTTLCISKSILFSLIDEDYNYINYYRGKDQQVFDYAVEKGYKITPKTFEKYKYVLGNSDSIMSSVIELDPNYIYYYYGNNEEIIKLALNKMDRSDIDKLIVTLKTNEYFAFSHENIFRVLINGIENKGIPPQVDLMNYYRGDNLELFRLAVEKGFKPNEKYLNSIKRNHDKFVILIDKYPELIEYYNFEYIVEDSFSIIKKSIKKGYIPSKELISKIMDKKYLYQFDSDLYLIAHSQGYIPKNSDDIIIFKYLDNPQDTQILENNLFNNHLIQIATEKFNYIPDIDNINIINANSISKNVMKYIILNTKKIEVLCNLYQWLEDKEICELIENKVLNYVNETRSLNELKYSEELFKLAMDKYNLVPSIDDITYKNFKIIPENIIDNIISNSSISNLLNLYRSINIINVNNASAEIINNKILNQIINNINDVNDIIIILYNAFILEELNKKVDYLTKFGEIINNSNLDELIKLYSNINILGNEELTNTIENRIVDLTNTVSDLHKLKNIDLTKKVLEKNKIELNLSDINYDILASISYEFFERIVFKSHLKELIIFYGNYSYYKNYIDSKLSLVEKRIIDLIKTSEDLNMINRYPELFKAAIERKNIIPSIKSIKEYNIDYIPIDIFKKIIENAKLNDLITLYYSLSNAIPKNINDSIINGILKYIKSPNDLNLIIKYPELLKEVILITGFMPDTKYLNPDILKSISSDQFENIIMNANIEGLLYLLKTFPSAHDIDLEEFEILEKIWDKICGLTNSKIEIKYYDLLINQDIDTLKMFFNYFPGEEKIYEDFNISFNDIVKYAPNFIGEILKIYSNNMLDNFNKIKDYWIENNLLHNSVNNLSKIRYTLSLLHDYLNNPTIYNIIYEKKALNGESRKNILNSLKLLSKLEMDDEDVKTLDDLMELKNIYINKYKKLIGRAKNNYDLFILKDMICKVLFRLSSSEVRNKLDIYGNTEDLKILLFNNRENPTIHKDILDALVLVSMMESIVNNNSFEDLVEIADNILSNYEKTFEILMLFSNYDERMRRLYEKELLINTTKIKENVDEGLLDKEMSEKFGVDVIDLSDKKYCLLEHRVSDREEISDLINGVDKQDMLTICLSVGSNRNQNLYYGGWRKIILATDIIPKDAFIRSSVRNMGSNGSVTDIFNDRDKNVTRIQRGAFETSATTRNNSEILAYRNGIKFKYILLPGGREPTEEELEYAKKYNLRFVKVQELKEVIEHPKRIDDKYLENKEDRNIEKADVIDIDIINSKFTKPNTKPKPRQIAIFTDAHGLFEPTLAVLEDARKRGISEIYSLGDNIGSGPSPREVLDLLREYNVKSIKGNHELYALGIDKLPEELKKHLEQTNATEEARRNSAWTRSQLTKEQLEEISNYPDDRVIELGGKKIYLTHYTKKYDNSGSKEIPKGTDRVMQGHIHFSGIDKSTGTDILTLRGVGIGLRKQDVESKAFYMILTETEDGYDMVVVTVPYKTSNLYHTINESEMPLEDAQKIESWSNVKR